MNTALVLLERGGELGVSEEKPILRPEVTEDEPNEGVAKAFDGDVSHTSVTVEVETSYAVAEFQKAERKREKIEGELDDGGWESSSELPALREGFGDFHEGPTVGVRPFLKAQGVKRQKTTRSPRSSLARQMISWKLGLPVLILGLLLGGFFLASKFFGWIQDESSYETMRYDVTVHHPKQNPEENSAPKGNRQATQRSSEPTMSSPGESLPENEKPAKLNDKLEEYENNDSEPTHSDTPHELQNDVLPWRPVAIPEP